MPMSPRLKALLKRFGEVQATTSFYAGYRPDGVTEYPGEHYPAHDLEPGEPALIVKISADGASRVTPAIGGDGGESAIVSVMELPEDEFWYFEAFRPALSRLALGAPGFLFEMELITLYGVFEAYLTDKLHDRLRSRPGLLSPKGQRALAEIGNPAARDGAAFDEVVGAEVRRLAYLPIAALLAHMRAALDMPSLTRRASMRLSRLSRLSGTACSTSGGRVDQRLAAADPRYTVGDRIDMTRETASVMAKALRDLACAVDQQ